MYDLLYVASWFRHPLVRDHRPEQNGGIPLDRSHVAPCSASVHSRQRRPEPLPWTQGGQRHGAPRHARGTGLRHDRDADLVEDGEAKSRPLPSRSSFREEHTDIHPPVNRRIVARRVGQPGAQTAERKRSSHQDTWQKMKVEREDYRAAVWPIYPLKARESTVAIHPT